MAGSLEEETSEQHASSSLETMLTHIVDDNGAQVMYASVTLILATVMSRGLRLMCLLKTRVLKMSERIR